jgi:flagellar biosynthesis protein FliR
MYVQMYNALLLLLLGAEWCWGLLVGVFFPVAAAAAAAAVDFQRSLKIVKRKKKDEEEEEEVGKRLTMAVLIIFLSKGYYVSLSLAINRWMMDA